LTPPREHARRFKKMRCITELLPTSETPLPSDKLVVQWYYMKNHCANRHKYVKSGKKLSDETIEMLTAYFQSFFAQRKSDGKLECAEVDRLKNRAQRTLAKSLCEQREARHTDYAHHKARERERGRYSRSRAYCRGDDDRRNDDQRRDAYGRS
jgi:hypothetical protein